MLISTLRIFKFALQNFWRNFWLSFITISMLVLTLLTINILLMLNTVTEKAIGVVQDRIELSVYFHPEAPEKKPMEATEYLRTLPQVRDVLVITPEEALKRFRERHKDDPVILESLEEVEGNPLGATLVVKATAAGDFPFIIGALDHPQFRDAIRDKDFADYEQIIERIRSTTDRIRMFGYGLSAIFLLITVLIIFNTVRMGIYIHREEIGIMKLVGATDRFVRTPFLLESLGYSLLAVLIVAAITYPLLGALEPRLDAYFDGNSTGLMEHFIQNGAAIFGLQFLALAVLNVVATSLAMRKYLKV